MTPLGLMWAIIIFVFIELFAFCIFMYLHFTWNIPVTLLRYTGNKGRPLMINTKGRKVIKKGIPRLYVKGYPEPVRDYLAENYYPTGRGKYGNNCGFPDKLVIVVYYKTSNGSWNNGMEIYRNKTSKHINIPTGSRNNR